MVECRAEDKHCCVTVADEGNGIDPELLPYRFNVFAHTDLNAHSKGLGLSLAIAYQIVLAHSGTIEVESHQGAGTTFTVRLPVMTPVHGDC